MNCQAIATGLIPLKNPSVNFQRLRNITQTNRQNNPPASPNLSPVGLIKINVLNVKKEHSKQDRDKQKEKQLKEKDKKLLLFQHQLTILLGQVQFCRIITRSLVQLTFLRNKVALPETINRNVPMLLLKLAQLKLSQLHGFIEGTNNFSMSRVEEFRKSILFTDFREVIEEMQQRFSQFLINSNLTITQTSNSLLNNILTKSALSSGMISTAIFLLSMAFRELRTWAQDMKSSNENLCRCFRQLDQAVQALKLNETGIPPEKLCEQLADIETCQTNQYWIRQIFCYCQ